MGFDEWWRKYNCVSDSLSCRDAKYVYESRQGEIDNLKAELETLQGMHNAVSLEAGNLVEERDELQKRVDICEKLRDSQFEKLWALTQAIEVARNGADEDFDLFLNYLSNTLKGSKNDNSNS